ncbi:hypothetical protein [Streptosporangium sp. NPDC020145]
MSALFPLVLVTVSLDPRSIEHHLSQAAPPQVRGGEGGRVGL